MPSAKSCAAWWRLNALFLCRFHNVNVVIDAAIPTPPYAMRQTAEQFLERPPKSLAPLYVIHGAEPLAALEAADCLRDIARKTGYVEREVFTAESGFDWGKLTGAG